MKKQNKCITLYCKNKRSGAHRLCCKCKNKKQRARNPISATFQVLKDNAKRRKLEFNLSLEWFTSWVKANGYIENKGRLHDCLTIDRVNNLRGYVVGNLEVLTKSENCQKFHNEDLKHANFTPADGEDLPF